MLRYTLARIATSIFVLWIVITLTFFLMRAIPGGPFTQEKNLPPEVMRNIEERYKLNDPLWKQYTDYLGNLARFDLGPSFKYEGRTVNDIIKESFPVSMQLGLLSIGVAVTIGISAGIISALRQSQWPDYVTMFFATIGVSVPNFVIATLLMYVFAVKLGWLPAALWGGIEYMILPVISLAALPTAFIARLTRSTMVEVMAQDYIKTAWAKGLPGYLVIYRHAIKNALIPVVTYIGPMAAGILTGSFVIESLFAIPGLGRHYVTSIYNRDYTTILGITIFDCALVIGMNFLVDIIYPLLDPRIKLDARKEA